LTTTSSSNETTTTTSATSNDDEGDVSVNIWLGPSDTHSPLHHDPFHNLLVQVHGHKYVRLYASSESDKLYPREGRLYNNSAVDVLNPNLSLHPLITEAMYWEVVLHPGDVLYIPRWCWHFVLALDHCCSCTSVAISDDSEKTTSENDYCRSRQKNEHVDVPKQCFERESSTESTGSMFCASVNFWWGPRITKQ